MLVLYVTYRLSINRLCQCIVGPVMYVRVQFDGWGPLRVINEDTVDGGTGFPTHPHANFNIFSYILSGALRHTDSMGNQEVLKRGEGRSQASLIMRRECSLVCLEAIVTDGIEMPLFPIRLYMCRRRRAVHGGGHGHPPQRV